MTRDEQFLRLAESVALLEGRSGRPPAEVHARVLGHLRALLDAARAARPATVRFPRVAAQADADPCR